MVDKFAVRTQHKPVKSEFEIFYDKCIFDKHEYADEIINDYVPCEKTRMSETGTSDSKY